MRRPTIFELLIEQPTLRGTNIKLRPRTLKDAENEYRWRRDEEVCRFDASLPLSYTFKEFTERYLLELDYPGLIFNLAIETMEGRHIGVCSLFNFTYQGDSAEIGIIIGEKEFWGKGYGTYALMTFMQHIFISSGTEKLVLRTLDWNIRAQKCFEKCGFKPYGNVIRGEYNFLMMETTREQVLEMAA